MSEPGRAREKTSEGAPKLLHAVREGMATIAGNGRLRILIGLAAAQTLVAGALTVLVVVIALQLLERDIA